MKNLELECMYVIKNNNLEKSVQIIQTIIENESKLKETEF